MFDVENRNNAYRNKALVLGVSIDGRHRAYPLKELRKLGAERISDDFADREVTVVWSKSAESAHLLDQFGSEIPSVLAYWFAWYAFHPDTEIFRAKD